MPLRPTRAFVRLALALALACALPASLASAVGDRGADGEFERRDSFHFTLYQDVDIDEQGGLRGARRFEQQILAELEGAYDTLDRLLALRPEKQLVVYVWDPALFDQEYAGLFRFPPPASTAARSTSGAMSRSRRISYACSITNSSTPPSTPRRRACVCPPG